MARALEFGFTGSDLGLACLLTLGGEFLGQRFNPRVEFGRRLADLAQLGGSPLPEPASSADGAEVVSLIA